MNLTIVSYKGVGSIQFGMTIDEVRAAVRLETGIEAKPFKKAESSELPTDAFSSIGVHVYYKKPGICEAIEMWNAASPTLLGETLIGRPFSEVFAWLGTKDTSIIINDAGLESMRFGISLYAPYAEDDPSEPVEGVMAFAEGYWE